MKLKENYAAPALLIIITVLLAVSGLIESRFAGDPDTAAIASVVLTLVIFLIPSLLFSYLRPRGYVKRLRLAPFGARHLLFVLLAAILLVSGGVVLTTVLYKLFPGDFSASGASQNVLYSMDGTVLGTLRTLLAFALVPAFCEELVFRSILLAEYERYGVPCAVFMSTLLFALLHLSLVRLPIYFFGGLVLAMTAYATRSVFAAGTVHFLYNASVLLTEDYVCRRAVSQQSSAVLFVFIAVVVMLLAAFFLFGEGQKIYRYYSTSGKEPSYRTASRTGALATAAEVFAAPPMILLLLLYIVLFIFS
ncbi:MAG: CPBP family intramembrane metalloprotease [Clostridia bacterium]|nr:CPBP family intramembrane metalloprotease [Clostridia bacterium]